MAGKSSSRNGARVIWVAIHTAEGARSVDSLRRYFDRPDVRASSHAMADDNGLLEGYVPYHRAAWTLRDGNPRSDNLELCGFAKWTRAEWLQRQGMLNNAALWIRRRCLANGVPFRKLDAAAVGRGEAGVIGHVDYTRGTGDGTHWDPGPNFPWDVVMARAATGGGGGAVPGKEEHMKAEDFTPDVIRKLNDAVWGGAHVPLRTNREDGVKQYPETMLFSLQERLTRLHLEPIGRRLAAIEAKQTTGGVDIDALAEKVAAKLGSDFSTAVAAELHKRLAE